MSSFNDTSEPVTPVAYGARQSFHNHSDAQINSLGSNAKSAVGGIKKIAGMLKSKKSSSSPLDPNTPATTMANLDL